MIPNKTRRPAEPYIERMRWKHQDTKHRLEFETYADGTLFLEVRGEEPTGVTLTLKEMRELRTHLRRAGRAMRRAASGEDKGERA